MENKTLENSFEFKDGVPGEFAWQPPLRTKWVASAHNEPSGERKDKANRIILI
jgi:hypothetical protein